ncbi:MAG: N-formylglutamate amidohydrolase, partial [Candidatus Puniceispirillaceae bacterium]
APHDNVFFMRISDSTNLPAPGITTNGLAPAAIETRDIAAKNLASENLEIDDLANADLTPQILPLAVLGAPPFMSVETILPPPSSTPSAVVLSSPHAGRIYPAEFITASIADITALRGLEDFGVDCLIGGVREAGITCISNRITRAYIDVNRPVDALDHSMFNRAPSDNDKRDNDKRNDDKPNGGTLSRHVRAGYGLLPRLTAGREVIYRQLLPVDEIDQRIALVHTPYHQAVEAALAAANDRFGRYLLIDCHSMPSHDQHEKPLADIVLGDLHQSTLDRAIAKVLAAEIIAAGFSIAWNHPYAGGYITKHYGRAATRQQSVQIEINRQLYMTRKYTLDPAGAARVAALLSRLGTVLSDLMARA